MAKVREIMHYTISEQETKVFMNHYVSFIIYVIGKGSNLCFRSFMHLYVGYCQIIQTSVCPGLPRFFTIVEKNQFPKKPIKIISLYLHFNLPTQE